MSSNDHNIERKKKKEKPAERDEIEQSVKTGRESGILERIKSWNKNPTRTCGSCDSSL